MLANILAMETLSCRLPPPSPAPDNPEHGHGNAVAAAAAIKDIRKALQTTKTLSTLPPSVTSNSINSSMSMPLVNDPWLPRAGDMVEREQPPLPMPPLPPPPVSSCPPSPACSTPPPPPPVELQDESDSEVEEERVPTPEIMKKDDEDLDTDQVKTISFNGIDLIYNLMRQFFRKLIVCLASNTVTQIMATLIMQR